MDRLEEINFGFEFVAFVFGLVLLMIHVRTVYDQNALSPRPSNSDFVPQLYLNFSKDFDHADVHLEELTAAPLNPRIFLVLMY